MAIALDEMDLSPPHSQLATPYSNVMTEETPCQRLVRTTSNIKRFPNTRDGYKQILTSLESDANQDPTNDLYVKIQKEYEEISALLENGGLSLQNKQQNVSYLKTQASTQNNLENRFSLPTTINSSEFPTLPTSQQTTSQQNAQAGGTTSSSTAANMNTTQTGVTPSSQNPGLTNTSTQGVQSRVTPSFTENNTPKALPTNFKALIKGLPKSTHVDKIKSNLEEQGFVPERVVQLIG
ncbi:hypothetical protein TNCV_4080231 [Trichonephila clavipes]|nr:hypothetical protein TNCV_4080231 [Trichonephila clavipes]